MIYSSVSSLLGAAKWLPISLVSVPEGDCLSPCTTHLTGDITTEAFLKVGVRSWNGWLKAGKWLSQSSGPEMNFSTFGVRLQSFSRFPMSCFHRCFAEHFPNGSLLSIIVWRRGLLGAPLSLSLLEKEGRQAATNSTRTLHVSGLRAKSKDSGLKNKVSPCDVELIQHCMALPFKWSMWMTSTSNEEAGAPAGLDGWSLDRIVNDFHNRHLAPARWWRL